jgi:hypothetical protein
MSSRQVIPASIMTPRQASAAVMVATGVVFCHVTIVWRTFGYFAAVACLGICCFCLPGLAVTIAVPKSETALPGGVRHAAAAGVHLRGLPLLQPRTPRLEDTVASHHRAAGRQDGIGRGVLAATAYYRTRIPPRGRRNPAPGRTGAGTNAPAVPVRPRGSWA